MNEYRNEQGAVQPENEQQTRVMPSVEETPRPVRHRRSERYQQQDAAQEAQLSRTEPPAQGGRVQTRYGAQIPTQREVPSQGVPRPAALERARQEQPAPVTPPVRRPVGAPGYPQRPQPGLAQRQPVQTGEISRARRPIPMDENEPAHDEQERRAGKGHGVLAAILVVVLVLGLAVLGLLMIPEDDSTLGQIKSAVTSQLSGLLGKGGKESQPAAQAMDFSAAPTQGTAPLDVAFTLTTSKSVTAVRLVDEDGIPLTASTAVAMDNADSRIWMLNMTVDQGYEGMVQAQIQDGESWLDTGKTQQLAILPPQQPPQDTGAFAAMEPTDTPMPEVTATAEPTAIPEATEEPAALATDEPGAEPTEAPVTAIPEPTEAPTQQPVTTLAMAVTPTPTIPPTEAPTPEPTAEPEPTEAAALLTVQAHESADPALIAESVVYDGTSKVENYNRAVEDVIRMPAGENYTTRPYGVMTYRGDAFRRNAAVGTVDDISAMALKWTAEAGSVKGSSSTYYGIGWTGQPAIIKWSKEVRVATNMVEDKKNTTALKEVIVAGLDGYIYFLDLADGQPTRQAINLGYPMKGTPSLHPLGYPIMTVGQYARKMAKGTGSIGLRFYDLLTQKEIYMIDGLDGKQDRPYYSVGQFDTSALIDPASDTLITAGTNGMVYLTKLNTAFDYNKGTISIKPSSIVMKSRTKGQANKSTAVESSIAMYQNYLFYADMDGILRCVDTSSLETLWAVDTGDAVQAAVSLDMDEDGQLWLYTANTLQNRSKGSCDIRRFNAATGEESWVTSVDSVKKAKNEKISGAMASAVIGEHDLGSLVYYALSNVSESGAKSIFGDSASACEGVLLALDKASGRIVWAQELEGYAYASPVAVYSEAGRGWIIQPCADGTITLLDGLTGNVLNTLKVEGTIEASPAVYGSTMVIGTTGKNTSYIYGISLE